MFFSFLGVLMFHRGLKMKCDTLWLVTIRSRYVSIQITNFIGPYLKVSIVVTERPHTSSQAACVNNNNNNNNNTFGDLEQTASILNTAIPVPGVPLPSTTTMSSATHSASGASSEVSEAVTQLEGGTTNGKGKNRWKKKKRTQKGVLAMCLRICTH